MSKAIPRISVIMSVYNSGPYLVQAIESILNQTFVDFELIIIDDGSTDNTSTIINNYEEQDSRVVIIRNPQNVGTIRSLNKGLRIARGDFITRQDGDDYSTTDRLEKQVTFLEANATVGVIGTAALLVDQENKPIRVAFSISDGNDIQKLLLDHMCICGASLMIRRSCWEVAGFYFDETLTDSEDYDLSLRLAEVTTISNLAEPHYVYRQHPNSTSYKNRHLQIRNKAVALEQAINRRYGSETPSHHLQLVARDYFRSAVASCVNDDMDNARTCLDQALRLYPTLLKSSMVDGVVKRYLPKKSLDMDFIFLERVFEELLPKKLHLKRIKSRLLARIYMEEVFATIPNGLSFEVYDLVWKGVRKDPTWLKNRGVVSLIVKSIFRFNRTNTG
jgi:glycosyltransferase involved in cell wall biosynthesis